MTAEHTGSGNVGHSVYSKCLNVDLAPEVGISVDFCFVEDDILFSPSLGNLLALVVVPVGSMAMRGPYFVKKTMLCFTDKVCQVCKRTLHGCQI